MSTSEFQPAPPECAEMDHALLDLMVIDEKTGVIGRVRKTACMDGRSRCILDIHISSELPSSFTVAQRLKQSFMEKAKS